MHKGTKGTSTSTTYRTSGGIPFQASRFSREKVRAPSEGSKCGWARRRVTQDRTCYGCRGCDYMSLVTIDQKTVDSLPHLPDIYDAYGVQVNALSVSEIFTLYEHTGFLYPDKAARLFPHLGQVRENWRRMLLAGESLLYVLTAGDKKRGRASLAVWRTTHHGWMSQHLVCENNPYASRAVMLAAAAATIRKGRDLSAQNCFRRARQHLCRGGRIGTRRRIERRRRTVSRRGAATHTASLAGLSRKQGRTDRGGDRLSRSTRPEFQLSGEPLRPAAAPNSSRIGSFGGGVFAADGVLRRL